MIDNILSAIAPAIICFAVCAIDVMYVLRHYTRWSWTKTYLWIFVPCGMSMLFTAMFCYSDSVPKTAFLWIWMIFIFILNASVAVKLKSKS